MRPIYKQILKEELFGAVLSRWWRMEHLQCALLGGRWCGIRIAEIASSQEQKRNFYYFFLPSYGRRDEL